MSEHLAALALSREPTADRMLEQLPDVRKGLDGALESLQRDPSERRAGMVALQVNGALRFVEKLREALYRETSPDAER